MSYSKCKICQQELYKEPLLKFNNMPKSAQYFPDANSVSLEKGVDLELLQCSGCGVVQIPSSPVSYYKEVIRSVSFSQEMQDFRLSYFEEIVDKYNLRNKQVIEIGCGDGSYLFHLNKFIKNVWGIEFSKRNILECKKKGLIVIEGFVEDENFIIEEGPFDAFFMFSFLEHLPEPNKTIRGIFNNLKEDGIGIVEVPNFDMILEKRLFSEFIPDHLFYFTAETLRTTLELNGFKVMEINNIWHNYIISAIIKKRAKLDLSGFKTQMERISKELNIYVGNFKNVAVWGAGHQALAIMSLCNVANKIKYVVDSATFKQGKYTPSTHIPIVSPETIKKDPVEAIIVIAGSYTDEVVRTIEEKFDNSIKIATIKEFGLEIIR